MAPSLQNQTRLFSIRLQLALLAILSTTLFCSTAYAQTITFSYELTCNIGAPGCPNSNLMVATEVGQTASDSVTVATVNSDVPGHTNPVPISGGSLRFQSTPATQVQCRGMKGLDSECYASYGIPGGNATITGGVFGLPSGSILLSGSFLGGADSMFYESGNTQVSFSGPINIFVNPVILANLGMAGLPNSGPGLLSDGFETDGVQNYFRVSVTFTTPNTRTLHSFTGGVDGALPPVGLTMDNAGNLYGVAYSGGSGGYGTVFQMKPAGSGWIFNTLYSFKGGSDGANPLAKVTVGPDGVLYGTTQYGGDNRCSGGCGTVFSLRPPPAACASALCPWTETSLYRFKGGSDGAQPWSVLTFDQAGNMYGTTYWGGTNGKGVVYQMTPSGGGWTENVIYTFTGGDDGGEPTMGLVFDRSGNLYGVNAYWGKQGKGVIFQLSPSGSAWTQSVLYSFQSSDGWPTGDLIFDQSSGNLYGSAGSVIFALTPSEGTWKYGVIYQTGAYGISMDSNGNLYGAESTSFWGGIFKLTPSGGNWTYSLLCDFTGGSDGGDPYGTVVFDTKGNLYSTTNYGGENDQGVVFELPHR